MDMYGDNNGFQVYEGVTPFDEEAQMVQSEDSLPVAPYQGTVGYGTENDIEAKTLPIAQEQIEMLPAEEPQMYQEDCGNMEIVSEQEERSAMDATELEESGAGNSETADNSETTTESAAETEDEDAAKKVEHEAAEARRKAEWEEKQKAKKAAEQEKLDQIAEMSDDAAVSAAMKRIGTDTEKLTRRNMKDCVAEYIQTRCLEEPVLARMVMHPPRKNMIRCFHYINRKAREFVEQEMKDNDIKPENGVYGSDVPDDLCYQWAEDYFRDPDAQEDEENEEKFTPKPYMGKDSSKGKAKRTADKKTQRKSSIKSNSEEDGQLSLFGLDNNVPEVKAG